MLAIVLRLIGVRYGLPLPVLNPDESNIVPRAWRMGQGHLDPGWYDYPSLLMGVLAPAQAFFGAPALGAARLAAVAVGVGGVAATWWLGRRAYGTGAALVGATSVAVATTHVAYSRMAVTDVLLTLAVTCVLALAIEGRIEWAGLAVGLAASAKYPGALTALPVVVAGWGRWRALGRAAGLAVAGFALTSPFVLIHAGAAWEDISRVQRLARAGWLGFENDPIAPLAYLDRLWEALGPLLIVALVGLAAALRRRRRVDVVLLSFVGVYWLDARWSSTRISTAMSSRSCRCWASSPEACGRRFPSRSSRSSFRLRGLSVMRVSSPARTPASARTHGSRRTSHAATGSLPIRRPCLCAAVMSCDSSCPAPGEASIRTGISTLFAAGGCDG